MKTHTCPTCGKRLADTESPCDHGKTTAPSPERGSLLTTLVLLTVITAVIVVLGL